MPEKGGKIMIGSYQVGNLVEIRVSDNGHGIPPSSQEKIFDLFFREVTDKPGHGIGLAGVRSYVRSLDGDVGVRSEGPGKGTTFTIRIPSAKYLST